MLDRISKNVLQYLLNCKDYTFHPYDGVPDSIRADEFYSSVDYLEKCGYLTAVRGADNCLISATLTHTGKHPREFNSIALKRYLLDKWIDLLALLISVLAFIGAYRHEISAVLQQLAQALTK